MYHFCVGYFLVHVGYKTFITVACCFTTRVIPQYCKYTKRLIFGCSPGVVPGMLITYTWCIQQQMSYIKRYDLPRICTSQILYPMHGGEVHFAKRRLHSINSCTDLRQGTYSYTGSLCIYINVQPVWNVYAQYCYSFFLLCFVRCRHYFNLY